MSKKNNDNILIHEVLIKLKIHVTNVYFVKNECTLNSFLVIRDAIVTFCNLFKISRMY